MGISLPILDGFPRSLVQHLRRNRFYLSSPDLDLDTIDIDSNSCAQNSPLRLNHLFGPISIWVISPSFLDGFGRSTARPIRSKPFYLVLYSSVYHLLSFSLYRARKNRLFERGHNFPLPAITSVLLVSLLPVVPGLPTLLLGNTQFTFPSLSVRLSEQYSCTGLLKRD